MCSFGDTCKFLHDRGNYKMGWQIEQEFQEKQKKRAMALMMGDDSDNEEPEKDDGVLSLSVLMPLPHCHFDYPYCILYQIFLSRASYASKPSSAQ